MNEYEKGYQPRSNLVKDENGALLGESRNILNRWKNYISQLLNVRRVIDVGQIEIDTAEPLVPEASSSDVEIAVEELKKCTLPGSDKILAELIKQKVKHDGLRSIIYSFSLE
jgi:hypothetical protein